MCELRTSLREPIPEIFAAAKLLRAGVDHHNAGNRDAASQCFSEADDDAVRQWTESIWGSGWSSIIQLRVAVDAPPPLAKSDRIPVRMPNAAERRRLIERDGYQCRFCGIPVVPDTVRRKIVQEYPEVVSWGRTNTSQHAALQAMWLQFDHVIPHARGGANGLDNVIITCAPCNYGKANYTIEELGLLDPRARPVQKLDWNGLVDFVPNLGN